MSHKRFVIIGAGPCGLGAAHRLQELGITDFTIVEREAYTGGLATSFVDRQGFTWDIGGHVQFSHYDYFDQLMDALLGNQWVYHERESWVWILDRFVPYPFQLNIHRLPEKARQECLEGLIKLHQHPPTTKPKDFEEWILQTAGTGIAKYFLLPYNFKVWAHQPRDMNATWVGERVAITDLKRVQRNIETDTDDVSWGPNNQFRFPLHGGTGAIWQALATRIGTQNIRLNHEVTQVDADKHLITFTNNEQISYDTLISTMPLDQLVTKMNTTNTVKSAASQLLHSTTHIVGIGLQGQPKEELKTKCWMYFPESDCPFYRVTLFSKYSPNHVPDNAHQWSLMTETAESFYKPVNANSLVKETIQGLKNTKLITDNDPIVSTWQYQTEYGYPTPSLHRDEALATIQPELMKKDIYSRGRFGMWKYEVSNQDHSLMQGKEVVDFLIDKTPEITAWEPEEVNQKKS